MSQSSNIENKPKLVVAIASRALFNLDESHKIFEEQGAEKYASHQIELEDVPLAPGVAFSMVRKLLALNTPENQRVEITLVSRNSADTGLRIFNSIRHHGLGITRAAFTRGESPYRYIEAFGAHLFLSASHEDVRSALDAGIAAATILPSAAGDKRNEQLRIAFDGDAVLFSDEAERVFTESGLDAFNRSEVESKNSPLAGGPFKSFLSALHTIQSEFDPENSPIRTALVTARAAPAHERVIRTLRSWGVRIDEALFLGGMDKGIFLRSFGADIFFDDQRGHCESASDYVATGHVPYGIKNVKAIE
jgi:5'-nucleotidase